MDGVRYSCLASIESLSMVYFSVNFGIATASIHGICADYLWVDEESEARGERQGMNGTLCLIRAGTFFSRSFSRCQVVNFMDEQKEKMFMLDM